MASDLERAFNSAMLGIYKSAKSEANYNATYFFNMLNDRGGLGTAKFLINLDNPSTGFTALWERGRLDLTAEAMVLENKKWHPLFLPEELEKAVARLRQYGYSK